MNEIEIQNKICEYLQSKGYLFWRSNNTPVFDKRLNSGYGAYRSQGKWAQPGLADILIVLKEEYGQLCCLEVKGLKGKQSADQKLFEKQCHLNNARYHVVRSVADVKTLGL